MTHTLELSPDVERALEAKARRRGVSLAAYLRDVAQRDAATPDAGDDAARNSIDRALALLEELTPIIQAGTRRADTPLDAAADLAALREERFADAH